MKKGPKCIVQTINLSSPTTCVRPKMVPRVVGVDMSEPCIKPGSKQTRWTPRPVTVRVCTREQVERSCPGFRDSTLKEGMKKRGRTVPCIVKGAVLFGLLYWSYAEGLWDPGDTRVQDFYKKIICKLYPHATDEEGEGEEDDNRKFRPFRALKRKFTKSYNQVVMATFLVIASLPPKAYRYLRDAVNPPEDKKEETDEISSKTLEEDSLARGKKSGQK